MAVKPNLIPSSEYDEQVTVVQYCDIKRIACFAIPNGGSRNRIEAARMQASGVKAGVPDLCIPVPSGKYHSLYIEMKYGRNKTSPKQDEWIERLQKLGHKVCVCYGANQAIDEIEKYLSGKE